MPRPRRNENIASPGPARRGFVREGMAECAAGCRLDDGLSGILGLPNLEGLRRLLASEPLVSNRAVVGGRVSRG